MAAQPSVGRRVVLWRDLGQRAAQVILISATTLLSAASLCAALGWLPWPELALSWSGAPLPHAGVWAQLALNGLFLLLCLYLPGSARILALEEGHRSFAMGVEDVARAYRQSHAADRAGLFSLSAEFDSVRARMEQLRRHPDFQHLEPELLQLAAQMSHETRELARSYSDVKVARARSFLQQRQEEVQALTDRLVVARSTCDELRRWLTDIDSDERQAQLQLKRLEADLKEFLPGLGYAVDFEQESEGNVVALPKTAPVIPKPVLRPERPEQR